MHGWTAMRRKLSLVRRLTARQRWTLLRASCWLLAVDLGLRTLGFSRVERLLALGGRSGAAPAEPARIEELTRLVDVAARHHLYPMTCLRRALVLKRLLRERGVVTQLRLGVRTARGHLEAHAWLERDGVPLGEAEVTGRFAPLAGRPRSAGGADSVRSSAKLRPSSASRA